jgi:hypothetical protein
LNRERTERGETSKAAVEARAGEAQFRDDCLVPSPTSGRMEGAGIRGAYRRSMFDAICVTALIAYFLHFGLAALRGGFREDEMMNLYFYWHPGALKSLGANICFWTPFYRPAGALYYLPLYSFHGLNPRPYRITQIIILAASIPMVYHLARSLASSRSVAFLASLALCYHVQMAELVFVGAFIYDVLCGFFYFSALAYYIRIRERGRQLVPAQLLAFLALYICALNSKEMAVSLPVIVLIYELVKCPRWAGWRHFGRWARSYAVTPLLAGLLTALYIYGKTHGPHSLVRFDAYRPRYSWTTFMDSNCRFVSQFFYQFPTHIISHTGLLSLWALVFLYALMRRDRMLWLMAFWIVIVPLPIAFLIPFRGGASLYLVFFGWAMILAKFASDFIALISKFSTLIGQAGGMGAATGAIIGRAATGRVRGAAIGAATDAPAGKVSASTFRIVGTLLVAFSLTIFTQWENQRLGRPWALLNVGQKASHVIQALRLLDLHPLPRSIILLKMKENPFQNKWHPLFIASLVWNDHSLRIWLEGVNQLTPQQLATVDYVISLSESDAKVIRAPEIPQSD